jgi:hypothetical protein
MEDGQIIELFYARSEEAIRQTKEKYGAVSFCFYFGNATFHTQQANWNRSCGDRIKQSRRSFLTGGNFA